MHQELMDTEAIGPRGEANSIILLLHAPNFLRRPCLFHFPGGYIYVSLLFFIIGLQLLIMLSWENKKIESPEQLLFHFKRCYHRY